MQTIWKYNIVPAMQIQCLKMPSGAFIWHLFDLGEEVKDNDENN